MDTLWLSPVHPSPNVDFGYDVADYDGVAPELGGMAAMERLLEDCRSRGLRVLLDGVYNHSSEAHPWFVQSRSGREGPWADWYIWREGRGGGPPNNWQSTFGGPAWRFEPARQQWHLCTFAPEQPDLNWAHPPVQEAILGSMARWLERGVSGFRLDVFNACHKHPELPDNPRRWFIGGLFYGYVGQHHIYDRDQPALAEMLAQMRSLADRHGALLVGETLDERLEYRNAAQWVGADRLHMAFHFALLHSPWGARPFAQAIQRQLDELGPERWPAWVIGNHDFPRAASRWGAERARCLPLLLLGLRGTPFLYQGDELGLPEMTPPRARLLDPPGRRYWPVYPGRDGCRTPMPWTEAPGRGFSSGEPWLPFGRGSLGRSVQAQEADPRSVLRAWRELLALRRQLPALEEGAQGPLRVEGQVLSWERQLPQQRLGIFLHMGHWASSPLPGRVLWRSGGQGRLQAGEGALVDLNADPG